MSKIELQQNFNKCGFYLRKLYPLKNITLDNKEKLILSALYYLNKTNFNEINYKKLMYLLPFRKKEIENIINVLLEKKCLFNDKEKIALNSDLVNEFETHSNIMFIELEIIKNKALSFSERLILCYLKSYCDKYKYCISTSETIADILNINLRTVTRALKKFQTLDILSVVENTNYRFDAKTKIKLNNKKIYDLYGQFKKGKISHYSVTRFTRNETMTLEKQINDNNISINNNKENLLADVDDPQTIIMNSKVIVAAIEETAEKYNIDVKEVLTNILKNMIIEIMKGDTP